MANSLPRSRVDQIVSYAYRHRFTVEESMDLIKEDVVCIIEISGLGGIKKSTLLARSIIRLLKQAVKLIL